MKSKSDIFGSPCTVIPKDQVFQKALDELDEDYTFNHVPSFTNPTGCANAIDVTSHYQTCSQTFDPNLCLKESDYIGNPLRRQGPYLAMSSYYWDFARTIGIEDTSEDAQSVKFRIDQMCKPKGLMGGSE